MRRALIIVGKAPLPGTTKTRLVPPLSPEEAADLYRGFLLDTLELAASMHWERTTLVHPRGHAAQLAALLGQTRVSLLEQQRQGLGHALSYAFERHFAEGCQFVTLIGSDNPTLPAEPLLAAQAALERGADLAIGPSFDGGYYLIAMRQPHLGVFDGISWSTPRVYSQTLERAETLGLRVQPVRAWYDVDEPADLERLQQDLASASAKLAPHTRATLERLAAAAATR